MPPKEQKMSSALAVSQLAGTGSVTSMMRVLKGSNESNKMLRLFLKNIHLSVVSRKEEDLVANRHENSNAPAQRDGEEPVLKVVRVAVRPPTKRSRDNEWDELVNWEPNSKKWSGGLRYQDSTKKEKTAFVSLEIPYEEWRKHYAKNKYGRYRGTEAPAENCILLPEDELKWRSATTQEETTQPTEKHDATEIPQPLKRTDTSLGYDPTDSPHTSQNSALSIQEEEAIFVEKDGHTAFQAVQVPISPHPSNDQTVLTL